MLPLSLDKKSDRTVIRFCELTGCSIILFALLCSPVVIYGIVEGLPLLSIAFLLIILLPIRMSTHLILSREGIRIRYTFFLGLIPLRGKFMPWENIREIALSGKSLVILSTWGEVLYSLRTEQDIEWISHRISLYLYENGA